MLPSTHAGIVACSESAHGRVGPIGECGLDHGGDDGAGAIPEQRCSCQVSHKSGGWLQSSKPVGPALMGGGAPACTALLQGHVGRAVDVGRLVGGVTTARTFLQQVLALHGSVKVCASCRAMHLPAQHCCS